MAETPYDGMKRCNVCGERIERVIEMPLLDGTGRRKRNVVRCMCACDRKREEERKKRLAFEEEQRNIDKLRKMSLMDERLANARFSTYTVTDRNRKAFTSARKYVEHFGEMEKKGQGLLFYGGVGTGKSYTAAAIANELIDRMVSVVMTSFVMVLGRSSEYGKMEFAGSMNRARLLVVDDLGSERGTDYSLEKVYDIIDSRYRSGKPMILTTNLELAHMKNCTDIRYARIYDRIFEMCYPVEFTGLSWRKQEAASKFSDTRKILEGQ